MSSRKRPVLAVGKRKTSKARVVISEGKGRVRINNTPIHLHEPWIAREKIMESLRLAGDYADKVDIKAKTHGGGVMSQAEAVRLRASSSTRGASVSGTGTWSTTERCSRETPAARSPRSSAAQARGAGSRRATGRFAWFD